MYRQKLYTEDDIWDIILQIRNDEDLKDDIFSILDEMCSTADAGRIKRIIKSGFPDDFYKYDSYLSEEFIRAFLRQQKEKFDNE